MKKTDRIIAICILLLVMTLFIQALDFPAASGENEIGPAYYPILLLGVLFILSILLVISTVVQNRLGVSQSFSSIKIPRSAIVGIVLAIGYILAVQYVDYYISTIVLMITSMLYLNVRNWKVIIGVSLGFCLFIYVTFFRLLNLVPPSTIW